MQYTAPAAILLVAMLVPAAPGGAQTTDYGSLRHYEELPEVLLLVDRIEMGDSFELRRAMRNHDIRVIVTASPGGNLYEGLQIASILHDNGVSTYVPADASCESSCANVFFGGTNRVAAGELGVHQFYSSTDDATSSSRRDVTTSVTQYTTADIIGIMNQFDTPPFVYEKMFGTDEIYYFDADEKQQLARGGRDSDFARLTSNVEAFVRETPSALDRTPVPAERTAALPEVHNVPVAPEGRGIQRFDDLDFFGMDLSPRGVRGISLDACERMCINDPSCAAYSYVTKTRWCWPKSGVENISLAPGTVSAVVDFTRVNQEAFDRPFIEVTGADILGYDIYPRGLRNLSLDECRRACESTTSCVGFSWVAKKAWCFPKYGVGRVSDALGIISGVKN